MTKKMNILTFYAGREDNGDLYIYRHHPVFKNGMWQSTHKFEDDIYIGGNDILPEVKSLPHESKRVTMALVQGREEDLLVAVLRKVARRICWWQSCARSPSATTGRR